MPDFKEQKEALVKSWISKGIIKEKRFIDAFNNVKREDFMLENYKEYSYDDNAYPILSEQTISQPTTVMLMTKALAPRVGDNILEIGSGSGYHAAILSELVRPGFVYTIEILPELYKFAKNNLRGYGHVKVINKDGSKGLPKNSPYDRILITAACSKVPLQLFNQLNNNGILVAPVGSKYPQTVYKYTKSNEKIKEESLGNFMFVPLRDKQGIKY